MTQKDHLEDFKFRTPVEIRFIDLDAFRHVNNAIYLTYCEVARTKYWQEVIKWDWNLMGIIIASATIDYIKPLTLKDQLLIYVRTSKVGNKSFELAYILTSESQKGITIHAKAKTTCVCIDYNTNKTSLIPSDYKKTMEIETTGNVNKSS
ncbi:acyl-CoA thioesterase [Olivibacter sp. SDN3]|uniref:acyl-CoA thioesterase n=1 Tax=Olivibacter sp. SDN3 TaxID=2764720 RepID=UPI0016517F4B|nr:acyl-CoA thioesterase [Olivibacter sp. SDN3]